MREGLDCVVPIVAEVIVAEIIVAEATNRPELRNASSST